MNGIYGIDEIFCSCQQKKIFFLKAGSDLTKKYQKNKNEWWIVGTYTAHEKAKDN